MLMLFYCHCFLVGKKLCKGFIGPVIGIQLFDCHLSGIGIELNFGNKLDLQVACNRTIAVEMGIKSKVFRTET